MPTISAMVEPRSPAAPADAPEPAGPGTDANPLSPLAEELAETRDKLLRALAEQQNIRKTMQREREEAVKFAASGLAEDLLDTLDNLRRAIESAGDDPACHQIVVGVEATERNLLAALARHGVQRISPLGETFDPHRHQAVYQRPGGPDGRIVEVLQPGYVLNGRLLRPAMVGVASGREG